MCEVRVAPSGPDTYRSEYPLQNSGGVCPRGSSLAELLSCRGRIVEPARRVSDRWVPVDLQSACREIIRSAAGKAVTILLDGNVAVEQLTAAAAWCRAWDGASLCLVGAPAEEQMLLGFEGSGAKYLDNDGLSDCDGFVVIGDAFSANPTCASAVFDRRAGEPATPLVVIDAAAGKASKFATHLVALEPGTELGALSAVIRAAGADADVPAAVLAGDDTSVTPSAKVAGAAIAKCRKLGILIAAEYGRCNAWRQIGFLAGRLAEARGGGIAPQTHGANALAAVRLARKLGAVSLASALSSDDTVRVAVGCDVLGMLGLQEPAIPAVAAALPNVTSESAQVVLPVAMAGEIGGTYLSAGARKLRVAPLLPAPAGVPEPAEVVAELARAAGASAPVGAAEALAGEPLGPAEPSAAPAWSDPAPLVLLLGRQAMHAGCGELTAGGSWQAVVQPEAELRISPPDAQAAGIDNLAFVTVRAGANAVRARVRFAPELARGVIVLPEGLPSTRRLVPSSIDPDNDTITATPVAAEVIAGE